MSERTNRTTLAYATPGVDASRAPRPTASLWVAAAFVWAALSPVLALAATILRLAVAERSGDGFLLAAFVGGLALAGAASEWAGVARRSEACVGVVFAVAVVAACFAGFGGFVAAMNVVAGTARGVDAALLLAAAFGLPTAAAFVAVTHGRWLDRIRRHAREAAR